MFTQPFQRIYLQIRAKSRTLSQHRREAHELKQVVDFKRFCFFAQKVINLSQAAQIKDLARLCISFPQSYPQIMWASSPILHSRNSRQALLQCSKRKSGSKLGDNRASFVRISGSHVCHACRIVTLCCMRPISRHNTPLDFFPLFFQFSQE
jgi:hypothetical protein